MIGYLLFLVPTLIAFWRLASRFGSRQALVALYGFHLMFAFDFAALLPGNVNVLFIHVLLIIFVGSSIIYVLRVGELYISPRTLIVITFALLLVVWMSFITFVNRSAYWSNGRITTYILRLYIMDVLALTVGFYLAREKSGKRLIYFGKFLFLGCILDSIVAIVQTISSGTLLTNNVGDYYLGVFQPLGEKFLERRDLAEQSFGFLEGVRTIQLGGLSFYRGWGTYDGSMVLLIIAAVITTLWLTLPSTRGSKFLWTVLICSWIGIVVAFFRTGLIILTSLTCLILILRFPVKLKTKTVFINMSLMAIVASVFIMAITLVVPLRNVVAANLDGFFGQRGQNEVFTANGRSSLWSFVIQETVKHPWTGSGEPITSWKAGWGLNNDPELELSAHSTPLEFAYRGGLIPLAIYIGLSLYSLLRLLQLTFNKNIHQDQRIISFSMLIALIAMLFYQQLNDIKIPQIAMTYWIIVGFAATYSPGVNSIPSRIL